MGSVMARTPPADRFWAKVRKGEGCWEWQAGILPTGYGGFAWFHGEIRKKDSAHRFSWELHFGPIPEGMCVCHHCDNRRCVRPSHLFLGTHRDNVQDMLRKGREGRHNAFKTHCIRGHGFTPENTVWAVHNRTGRPRRFCRACRQLANAA